MSNHSPACERVLRDLLSAPIDSVDHRMAADLLELDETAAFYYLITVSLEDPHPSRPVEITALLFPLLRREVAS